MSTSPYSRRSEASADKTWVYVNWLTHARNATPIDARIAQMATRETVERFLATIAKWRLGAPARCRTCGSYQLELAYDPDEGWFTQCTTCGRTSDPPDPSTNDVDESSYDEQTRAGTDSTTEPPLDDCVAIEDFGIYLTPRATLSTMEQVQGQLDSDTESRWANPFAIQIASGLLSDAHRVVFDRSGRTTSFASELVYTCESDSCVNPSHVVATELPGPQLWTLGIIVAAAYSADGIELLIDLANDDSVRLVVQSEIFTRLATRTRWSDVRPSRSRSSSIKSPRVYAMPMSCHRSPDASPASTA